MRAAAFVLLLVACGSTGPRIDVRYVADAAAAGVVRGTATSDAGPAVGLTAAVILPDGKNAAAVTDEQGAFVLEPVPPGKYKLELYYIGRMISREIEVRAGQTTVIRVTGIREEAEF